MKLHSLNKFKYTIFGVFFGLLFPFIAVFTDLYRLGLYCSIENIFIVHVINPIHYIVDLAPFILGIISWFVGDRQDKIEHLNSTLQKEIEYQTASLRKSTKQLQESLHFKDIFWANMSHEIRTPMNGIIGMLNIIKDDNTLSVLQKEKINIIYDSSLGLMNILNDVLDLSKIEENKMQLIPRNCNLNQIINHVTSIFMASAENKGIKISYEIVEGIHSWIRFDNNRFSQILSNLIGNAIKFTNDGKIEILVESIKKIDDNKAIYQVSVSDTGIGLNEEDQKVIFEEFHQLDYRNSSGTGLGLTICKKLVRLMGGEINVNSQLGKGSVFSFTFQVDLIEQKEVQENEANDNNEKVKYDLKILLVEDNVVNQKVANLMLEKLGCKVEIANNGHEALNMFSPNKFDLIFMDVQMPVMDGISAIQELNKKFDSLPPIIGLSANALKVEVDKYLSLGMDDYLSKPILIKDLNDVLKRWSK
ncbi:MAG: ATP-binding protein [Saprospiraceae bacterium]|nr:ATP-binding protein [Saprospiraceae bacterium]